MTDIDQRAREMLAAEYDNQEMRQIAKWIRSRAADDSTHTPALRAITKAIQPSGERRAQMCECGEPVFDDGLCRDCFDEINGQFGVGA